MAEWSRRIYFDMFMLACSKGLAPENNYLERELAVNAVTEEFVCDGVWMRWICESEKEKNVSILVVALAEWGTDWSRDMCLGGVSELGGTGFQGGVVVEVHNAEETASVAGGGVVEEIEHYRPFSQLWILEFGALLGGQILSS